MSHLLSIGVALAALSFWIATEELLLTQTQMVALSQNALRLLEEWERIPAVGDGPTPPARLLALCSSQFSNLCICPTRPIRWCPSPDEREVQP